MNPIEIKKITPDMTSDRVFGVDLENLPFTDTFRSESNWLVGLAPEETGGNHKHSRTEILLGLGDLTLFYLDENDNLHSEKLYSSNKEIIIIKINPWIPHSVKNESKTDWGYLYELADGDLSDAVEVDFRKIID